MRGRHLTEELKFWIRRIEQLARDYKLDFFPTIFEMVSYEEMNMLASYQGFPVRYRHWRWGMEYERLCRSYEYGLHKIYEMVINTNPSYAYLLEGNSLLDHKLVIGHVFAHVDFFKNNAWYSRTDRKMLDRMANHAARMARISERYGTDVVENFVDTCLSIDNLIDVHSAYAKVSNRRKKLDTFSDEDAMAPDVHKLPARGYMDRYINPEDVLEEERQSLKRQWEEERTRFPAQPERDVLHFLLEHAPLQRWQRQVLEAIRKESFYFAPQAMTKIMNEGWASYWHSKLMTEHICSDTEIIDFACVHSGTMAMSQTQINPYKIGLELFRDIEERWDKGRFGLEYDRCDNMAEKTAWDRQAGLGREKIFQVRQIYNDVMFIDEFFTPEFCERQKLFTFGYNGRNESWEIKTREAAKIKAQLVHQLTNFGQPVIYVEDANYRNRSELLLWHKHDGQDLKTDYARATLKNLVTLWSRPVHIRTIVDEKPTIWTHDGESFGEETE